MTSTVDFEHRSVGRNARLRELLTAPPVLAPGCHDALSARVLAQSGSSIVYMGGFASTGSLLGRPDVALLTGTQMIDNARRIAAAVDVPVIADADTGYGNAINVINTVHEYEAAGVSGIHLEDQVAPKRCGHMQGKSVIAAGEMIGKIKAAASARSDPDFVLIARTDDLAVHGVDAAIDRALRYADAGADLLWVEAPTSEDQIDRIVERLPVGRIVLNWVEGGLTPMIPIDRIRQYGFALVLFPIGSVLTVLAALREHYRSVLSAGTPLDRLNHLPSFDDFTDTVGLSEIQKLSAAFSDPDEGDTGA